MGYQFVQNIFERFTVERVVDLGRHRVQKYNKLLIVYFHKTIR